ncbi:hypothetical protein NF212_08355 [Parasalinivibrio latis]|uniref:J domain-containing protein n=1 Tax=Parasalinivibrio latis TaxID=2952610 RepID=UPI0030E0017D
MANFWDILGLQPNASQEQAKLQFRKLTSAIHPDKGGSKALMQLVGESYQQVKNGNGSGVIESLRGINGKKLEEVSRALIVEQRKNALLDAKVETLENENRRMSSELEMQRKSRSRTENVSSQARMAELRLKKENDALRAQVEQLAEELAQKRFREETKPGSVVQPYKQHRKNWPFVLATAAGCLLLSALGIFSFLHSDGSESQDPARTVTIVHNYEKKEVNKKVSEALKEIESQPDSYAFPEPVSYRDIGTWHIGRSTRSRLPYIAVQNEEGSYVVADCTGSFYFFLNEENKPLHVAPNLEYISEFQQYHVYSIPYGQGATAETWTKGRRLRVDKETFNNHNFVTEWDNLRRVCLSG